MRNNFVGRVFNDQTAGTGGFTPQFGASGIRLNAGTGHQVYNNTVHLYGAMGGTVNANLVAALAVFATTVTGCDIRNNLLSNQMTGGNLVGGNTRFVAINLPTGGTSAMNLTLNNNAYFEGQAANSRMAVTGITVGAGDFLGVNFNPGATTPVANFRNYSSTLSVAGTNDNGSQAGSGQPQIISDTNFHLVFPSSVLGAGAPIGSVTTDYDNDPRPGTAPDIGADELVQSTGGSFPSGTFYNAAGVAGDLFSGDVTITNSFLLTGGTVGTGPNTLTINCGATVTGASASNYIIGNLKKMVCAPGVVDFEVGSAIGYSPVNTTVTAIGGGGNDSLAVRAVEGYYGENGEIPPLNPNSLQRYWDLNETGSITADIRWNFLPADVVGGGVGYRIIRVNGLDAASFVNDPQCGITPGVSPCVDVANNFMFMTAVSNFSKWTAGPQLAPTASGASISGRVLTADGRGIKNVTVTLVSASSVVKPQTVSTGQFGVYNFEGLPTGQVYIITVEAKRFTFANPTQVIELSGNVAVADFVANPIE